MATVVREVMAAGLSGDPVKLSIALGGMGAWIGDVEAALAELTQRVRELETKIQELKRGYR